MHQMPQQVAAAVAFAPGTSRAWLVLSVPLALSTGGAARSRMKLQHPADPAALPALAGEVKLPCSHGKGHASKQPCHFGCRHSSRQQGANLAQQQPKRRLKRSLHCRSRSSRQRVDSTNATLITSTNTPMAIV